MAVVRSVGHGKAGIKKGVIISDDQFEALQTWSCTQRTTWWLFQIIKLVICDRLFDKVTIVAFERDVFCIINWLAQVTR